MIDSRNTVQSRKPPQTKLPAWEPSKAKYDHFSETRRMSLVEVVDLAIDALLSMDRDQLDALVARRVLPDEVQAERSQPAA